MVTGRSGSVEETGKVLQRAHVTDNYGKKTKGNQTEYKSCADLPDSALSDREAESQPPLRVPS
jgi:hypothetical protein